MSTTKRHERDPNTHMAGAHEAHLAFPSGLAAPARRALASAGYTDYSGPRNSDSGRGSR